MGDLLIGILIPALVTICGFVFAWDVFRGLSK